MLRLELAARVTPDSAQALWYELESRFDAAGPKPALVIDAAAVRHLSAAAVQVLLVARQRAQRDGGALVMTAPSPDCVECLRIMGASSLLSEVPA